MSYYEQSMQESMLSQSSPLKNNSKIQQDPSKDKALDGKPDEKTFMTLQKKEEESSIWKPFDFLYPAGRLAKLVKER